MISQDTNIGFIGAGNMATALIEGLLANGVAAPRLWASDTAESRLDVLAARGVNVTTDNALVLRTCATVVLAVKPQVMMDVLVPLRETLLSRSVLLISIAAGIPVTSLETWTHAAQAIVRCMPNTPALVQAGASGLFANTRVSATQRQFAESLLQAVGIACWLDSEEQIDAVTALSGSGPAYFFLLMEAMQVAGTRLGLPADVAKALCLQTAFGAAKLALGSDVDVGELRRRVTSPRGTTEAALRQFEADGFAALVERALNAAATRSRELAEGK